MGSQVEGIQGQGLAGVWGGGPNFWQYANMVGRKDQAAAQKALDNERKLRDDTIKDLRQFDPGKVWEPFYSELQDYIDTEVTGWALDKLNRGVPSNEITGELTRRQGGAKKYVNQINYYKQIHEEAMDSKTEREKEGVFIPNYYDSPINDYFFNGRQAKQAMEINPEGIEQVFNDSRGYNMQKIATDFMKVLPEQLMETFERANGALGEKIDTQIVKTKLGLMYDKDGHVKLNPKTLMPEISMTDHVAMLAMANPYLQNYVRDNIGEVDLNKPADMEKTKNLLAPLLTPLDPRSVQLREQQGFKYNETDRKWGSGYSVPEPLVAERYDTLHRITHGQDPELLAAVAKASGVNIGYGTYTPKDENGEFRVDFINVEYPNPDYKPATLTSGLIGDPPPQFLTEKLSLGNEEERQKAMERLNTIMDDKLPSSDKIGENLTNYRKRKRKENNLPKNIGESGVDWK
jgi:hypothetical protein